MDNQSTAHLTFKKTLCLALSRQDTLLFKNILYLKFILKCVLGLSLLQFAHAQFSVFYIVSSDNKVDIF